ncbi:MAG: NAD(P)/FAD-dependent oxidoreductase [Candidatus Omnitrophota bacterium]|jgi:dihydrolipoamide dehydrogenase
MYDLAIIGAGAAGIASAKHALKHGLKTVLFDTEKDTFGGTCLNHGCIPAKFLINSSKLHKSWPDSFKQKNDVVNKIKKATFDYLEKVGIKTVWARVSFLSTNTLMANGEKIEAKNIIIATGSRPKPLFSHPKAIFAEELFSKENIGENFLIVGAGYIGIELASLLNNLNKHVTVVEKEENILPFFDKNITSRLRILLEKKGLKIDTASDVKNYNLAGFDNVILSVGRQPNIESLDIEKTGIFFDKGGWIKTDSAMRTNVENIYACGDVVGKKLLAYIAEYQAKICIGNIMGEKVEEDYKGIADCVFSLPSVAKVGILEEEAKAMNLKYKCLKSNFFRFSSSYVYDDQEGFMQVLVDQEDRIIGAGIISLFSAELISIFSHAIRNNLKVDMLRNCVFVHPTLSEIIPALLNELP